MDTVVQDIQADLAARLRADEVLAGIPIVTERAGDPLAEAEVALGLVSGAEPRAGICIVVLQLAARPDNIEVPNPLLQLQPRIRVLEAPLLNTTGTTALAIARRVLRVLHHYEPGGIGTCLIADSPAIIPAEDPIAPLAYDVALLCYEASPGTWTKVATPTIWPEDGAATAAAPIQVSIACDTAGAVILFTTDGTPPYRGNPSSAVYLAPFAVDGETLVRASAWLTGSIASDTVAVQYT